MTIAQTARWLDPRVPTAQAPDGANHALDSDLNEEDDEFDELDEDDEFDDDEFDELDDDDEFDDEDDNWEDDLDEEE